MSILNQVDFNDQFEVTRGFSFANSNTSMSSLELSPSSSVDPNSPLTKGDVIEIVNEGGNPRASRLSYTDPAFDVTSTVNQTTVNAVLDTLFRSFQTRKRPAFVLEGMSSRESGYLRNNLTAVHGTGVVKTKRFTAGAYAPGLAVTCVNGLPQLLGSDVRTSIGEVYYYNATEGTLEIRIFP